MFIAVYCVFMLAVSKPYAVLMLPVSCRYASAVAKSAPILDKCK